MWNANAESHRFFLRFFRAFLRRPFFFRNFLAFIPSIRLFRPGLGIVDIENDFRTVRIIRRSFYRHLFFRSFIFDANRFTFHFRAIVESHLVSEEIQQTSAVYNPFQVRPIEEEDHEYKEYDCNPE